MANAPPSENAPSKVNSPPSENVPNNKNMSGGGAVGSKAQVFHGTARRTKGGLTRKDLIRNKRGKIVSRKQAAAGKRAYTRLVKAGYKPKKGVFKLFTRKHK